MLTVKAITEKIDELTDEVTAIVELAETEKRDLSEEETSRIDAIQGKGDEAGELGAYQVKLERAQKIEARKKKLAAQRGKPDPEQPDMIDTGEGIDMSAIRVPIADRPRGAMKAFTTDRSDHPEQEAYIAGLFFAAAVYNHRDSFDKLDGFGIRMQNTSAGDAWVVPEILESTIIRLVENFGIFRQFCRVVPMGPGTLSLPRRTQGYTTAFTAELQAIAESEFDGDNVVLTAQKLAALTRWSSELPEDAAAQIGDLLVQEMATAFSWREDMVGFRGDGTPTDGNITGLEGALQASSVIDAPAGVNTFGEMGEELFTEAIGKLPEFPGLMPRWFCHKSCWANSMQRIALAGGGNATENYERGVRPMFLGYPVVFTQVLHKGGPATDQATNIVCYFGDLSMSSTMGDKRGLSIESDRGGKYFETDAIAIKGTERFDIKNHEMGSSTATDDAGPMIGIKLTA